MKATKQILPFDYTFCVLNGNRSDLGINAAGLNFPDTN